VDAKPGKRFTNERIAFAPGQASERCTVNGVCRTMGVSEPKFYRWTKQFVGKRERLVADLRWTVRC
jgi:putative transposase